MKYVLDTNAVSALMRGDSAFIERLQRVSRNDVGLPQPVLAEIVYGIERLPSSRRKDSLLKRLEWICEELPRLPWTDDVSERFGSIKASLEKKGKGIEDLDIAIAAHALAIQGVLVSASTAQMTRVPDLTVEDWGNPRAGGKSGA